MPENFISEPLPEDIPSAELRHVYEMWLSWGRGSTLQQREHLKPDMLIDHLPYLVLVDYVAAEKRFQVRLIGTKYTEAIGFEVTGKFVDEVPKTEAMQARFSWIVENKKPYYAYLDEMAWADKDYRHYAVVGCPLFDDNGDVNMILYRVSFDNIAATA